MGRLTNPHRADCDRCAALCCVLAGFTASDAFAFTKPEGTPCRQLVGHRCSVHESLEAWGMRGCRAFDCFGAGQRATALFDLGSCWTHRPLPAGLDAVFGALCVVQYCRWLLHEAWPAGAAPGPLRAMTARLATLAEAPASQLSAIDVGLLSGEVARLLPEPSGPDHRFADLHEADLQGEDLRDANLAFADLRGARLQGADLSSARFLSQATLLLAHGDSQTRIPRGLARPDHWEA